MTAFCAAPRHDGQDEPAPAEAHAALCRPCRTGLAWDLRRLPGLHADLEQLPAAGDGDGSGLPFSEPAADCRSQILHDVTYWAWEVGGKRGFYPPWPPEPRRVAAWAGWLAGQVTWCSFRDWAPDMAGALSADRCRAQALLAPFIRKEFEIPGPDGICAVCEASGTLACENCGETFAGAAFAAHLRADDEGEFCLLPRGAGLVRDRDGRWLGRLQAMIFASDGDRRRPFFACPGCGQRWEPEQWMSYGRQVIRRRSLQGAP